MPQFTNLDPPQLSSRNYLWQSAKKNFYYRNDYLKASYLCNLIISRHPFSEEADDAKLLLHDIAIECLKFAVTENSCPLPKTKKSIVSSGKTHNCLYYCSDGRTDDDGFTQCFAWRRSSPQSAFLPAPVPVERRSSARMPIAIAVVALPIIGIARDGLLGIAIPEVVALAIATGLFWGASKIRGMMAGLFGRQRAQDGCPFATDHAVPRF